MSLPKVNLVYDFLNNIQQFLISEIATILFRFVQLMRDGNLQQCEQEFQKLPTMNENWLSTSTSHSQANTVSFIIFKPCHSKN